uniref:Uncharacterized protein n=1 Tax=Myotis myotis TaxID=51298 RepID=A0A7J7WHQ2_MYOMY|nr:hypothetical protein mMyoMyo1_012111 [Myotis myotis]
MPVSRCACLYQEDSSRAPVPLDLNSILIIRPALHTALSLLFQCCLQSEALAWTCQIIQKPWCQWQAKDEMHCMWMLMYLLALFIGVILASLRNLIMQSVESNPMGLALQTSLHKG